MKNEDLVVIGFVGSVLDAGFHEERWRKWRPTVSLCRHPELPIARFELLHQKQHTDTARCVAADIARVSPGTRTCLREQNLANPWDFEEVYSALLDFARAYPFDPEKEDYLVHITTGTHVQQICLFLLTESRHFPARLVQTSPAESARRGPEGKHAIIDLDLSKYDRIASRFAREQSDAVSFLKDGIATRNDRFNALIERIERVAIHAKDPILLTGQTGVGKSKLARRVYELKKSRHQIEGPFVEVNCATLRGDSAMSALFGHVKGAFTGATRDRAGLLRAADGGLLFLDEVGELGPDEQAMLLRALEEKRFLPFGGDREVSSNFQLIAGTNRDLAKSGPEGRFRDDLLARINLWTFRLPGLRERPEDIEPNLDYEMEQMTLRAGRPVSFSKEARARFLDFATSAEARWTANFRDLNASVVRMATLSGGGRVTEDLVVEEIDRLKSAWAAHEGTETPGARLEPLVGEAALGKMDLFDRAQLEFVVGVCRDSASLSDAGRKLFAASREKRSTANDADRLRKYLDRFDLDWPAVRVELGARAGRRRGGRAQLLD
jgi:transcriptional regulatory protein RtcR